METYLSVLRSEKKFSLFLRLKNEEEKLFRKTLSREKKKSN